MKATKTEVNDIMRRAAEAVAQIKNHHRIQGREFVVHCGRSKASVRFEYSEDKDKLKDNIAVARDDADYLATEREKQRIIHEELNRNSACHRGRLTRIEVPQ